MLLRVREGIVRASDCTGSGIAGSKGLFLKTGFFFFSFYQRRWLMQGKTVRAHLCGAWGLPIFLILLIYSPSAWAVEGGVAVGQLLLDENGEEVIEMMRTDEFMAQQAASDFFTTRPSVTSSTRNAGERKTVTTWQCINFLTGAIVTNADITFTLTRVASSGGHDHDDSSRPVGQFDPASTNTGSTGIIGTVYTAPEVSGTVNFRVDCFRADILNWFPFESTIGVEVPGLTSLPSGADYNLIGATSEHTDNHYVLPQFATSIASYANDFFTQFSQKLDYNDASLIMGGLFDISGGWSPPHKSHREGEDIDLRTITLSNSQRNFLILKAPKLGIKIIQEGNHWHLRG